MESLSTSPQEQAPTNPKHDELIECYGEEYAAELIDMYMSREPDMSFEDAVTAVYEEHIACIPLSTDWPDISFDHARIFG